MPGGNIIVTKMEHQKDISQEHQPTFHCKRGVKKTKRAAIQDPKSARVEETVVQPPFMEAFAGLIEGVPAFLHLRGIVRKQGNICIFVDQFRVIPGSRQEHILISVIQKFD